MANEQAIAQHGLKPLARVVAYSVVGVDPTIMGLGPAPAIKAILKVTGKTLNDIDLVEVRMKEKPFFWARDIEVSSTD